MKNIFNFQKRPIVHLYTICWNEEYILKYFFKHYDGLVDRYIFFDNGSNDGTLALLEKHPKVEIRRFINLENNDSYVLAAQDIHNHCWKESRGIADWVIITAVDEFLYAPRLRSYLATCSQKGVTAIPALGFQMISQTRPQKNTNLTTLVKRGCPWTLMNKLSVFNPDKIIDTNQEPGRHSAQPVGEVKYPAKDELLLLHYKYLSFEDTFKRHADLEKKMGSVDRENRFGVRYAWDRQEFGKEWDYFQSNSIENIFTRKYDPHVQHSPRSERWWRRDVPADENNLVDKPLPSLKATETIENRIRHFPHKIWREIPLNIRVHIINIPFARNILHMAKKVFTEKSMN